MADLVSFKPPIWPSAPARKFFHSEFQTYHFSIHISVLALKDKNYFLKHNYMTCSQKCNLTSSAIHSTNFDDFIYHFYNLLESGSKCGPCWYFLRYLVFLEIYLLKKSRECPTVYILLVVNYCFRIERHDW